MKAHFSIYGVPVRVQPFFFVIIVMLALPHGEFTKEAMLQTAIWALVVFVSILWHELGHAWMMRRHGYAPWIELYGMGGRTGWGKGPGFPTPKARVLVSLAGPFAGFFLGGLVWLATLALHGMDPFVDQALMGLLWVNIGWGLVNLIPMLPWDGGAAMHGVFDATMKNEGKGQRAAGIMTLVVAALCGAALWHYQPTGNVFWLWFLLLISVERGVRALRAPPPQPAAPPAAPKDVFLVVRKTLADLDPEALVATILSKRAEPQWQDFAVVVRKHADSLQGDRRAEALEVAAWSLLMAGDAAAAAEAADAMLPAHDPSVPLAALLAIHAERFDVVVALHDGPRAHVLPPAAAVYALWAVGRRDDAWALITDRDFGHMVDAALFYRGRFEDSAALAERLFDAHAHPSDAFNAACAYSRLEQQAEGLRWLERAVDGGLEARAQLDEDKDLEYLRRSPEFKRIRDKT